MELTTEQKLRVKAAIRQTQRLIEKEHRYLKKHQHREYLTEMEQHLSRLFDMLKGEAR